MAEEPDSSCDDNTRNGFVRIRLRIPDLEPMPPKKAKNADIQQNFTTRSYSIKVSCNGTSYEKSKSWDDIEFDIVPGQSLFEVEKNFIHVFLKKKNPRQSAAEFCQNGTLV